MQKLGKKGNDPDGFASFLEHFKTTKPSLIVFEAAGGYKNRSAYGLIDAGFSAEIVNPMRVWQVAERLGILA